MNTIIIIAIFVLSIVIGIVLFDKIPELVNKIIRKKTEESKKPKKKSNRYFIYALVIPLGVIILLGLIVGCFVAKDSMAFMYIILSAFMLGMYFSFRSVFLCKSIILKILSVVLFFYYFVTFSLIQKT
jgi:hypothetical protein